MSNPLYDNLPNKENPLIPDVGISRPQALARLMHVFNAGYELGFTGADANAVRASAFSFYPNNDAYQQWLAAGYVYGIEKDNFSRNEAVEDWMKFKEGKQCKLRDRLQK